MLAMAMIRFPPEGNDGFRPAHLRTPPQVVEILAELGISGEAVRGLRSGENGCSGAGVAG
jgi:hypothetical protein